jgi:isovaleryl-CoA dehydrogenase
MATLQSHKAVVEEVVRDTIEPDAAATDGGRFPRRGVEALGRVGLLGLVSSAEVGGTGQGFAAAAETVETVSRSCASTALILTMHYCATAVIEAHGDLVTRQAIAAGRHLSTLAFSEAGSRSHFWVPVSTATADGADVRLDARKSWVTAADGADSYVWCSRPLAAEGLSTLWLVPRGVPGLEVSGGFDGLGLRGNASRPMAAVDVSLPMSARLGPDGGGFDVMMGVVLPWFQVLNAATSVGIMQAATERTAAYAASTRLEHLEQTLADQPITRGPHAHRNRSGALLPAGHGGRARAGTGRCSAPCARGEGGHGGGRGVGHGPRPSGVRGLRLPAGGGRRAPLPRCTGGDRDGADHRRAARLHWQGSLWPAALLR